MYDLNDTIVAVSSPNLQERVIIRITGPRTIEAVNRVFTTVAGRERRTTDERRGTRLMSGNIIVDDDLKLDAQLYLFPAPHSYTGEDVAELHVQTNPAVAEALMSNFFSRGLRMAGPGEFTARAYLAGKMDLAQAEAVNEIVVSSNAFQLAAAEKLLSGRLAEATAKIQSELMDCLSLVEAGLDFSGEDIEFITAEEAEKRIFGIKISLKQMLAGSIRSETIIDLPAVGIAGATNVGKSSLLNKLLGEERSIVSQQHKTTRDVLTGLLSLAHYRCVLFDCAGLLAEAENILDDLAQQAAVEALRNSAVVVFCVDVSKEDWSGDLSMRQLVETKVLIPVATKADLVSEEILANRLIELNNLFNAEFLSVSVVTGFGLEQMRDRIDNQLIETSLAADSEGWGAEKTSAVVLTARHRQAVTDAIENIGEAINELKTGNEEVAAMMLRAAYKEIGDIERHHVDEEVLDRIFSRFCIGK
jgi:tRNA modification GTPase